MSQRSLPVAIALGLAALLAAAIWFLSGTPGSLVNDEPGYQGPPTTEQRELVFIDVRDGESADDIGNRLEDAGVIDSGRLFRVLTGLMRLQDHLEAGEYEFFTGETALTTVLRISRGETSARTVVVREGLRKEEIAQLLEQRGVVTAQQFLQALDGEYRAGFLNRLPPNTGLEGFLFPATYGFSLQGTPEELVQQMLDAFDQRYQEQIQPKLRAANLTLRQAIVLASIIEREARVPEDRPLIASVFLNRRARGMRLDADPTVQYAVGNDPASVQQYGYWKRDLTLADLATPSPYNTYMHTGLPPGPIANPGLASILAVLEPAQTNYLYFVAGADGRHVFAETLEEHQRNICQLYPERSEC
ncbi:MAG: endolytic transglycosylase MltG [Dehalococcoidia bacterium]